MKTLTFIYDIVEMLRVFILMSTDSSVCKVNLGLCAFAILVHSGILKRDRAQMSNVHVL